MTYDDEHDFNAFDFQYRGTFAQHRDIELRLQSSSEYQEWAVLQAAIRNGRGLAVAGDYQDLCRALVQKQVACSRLVCKIINEVLR